MNLLRINWETIITYCEQLAHKIDFKPDIIIGVSRGGLVPTRILSDIMGISEIGIVGIKFYKGVGETNDKPKITQELTIDLKGKKVLIVDDVADSGKSLLAAKNYIIARGARIIKTATLHFKPSSIFTPDYYLMCTDAWIVYPWEIHETEREIEKNQST